MVPCASSPKYIDANDTVTRNTNDREDQPASVIYLRIEDQERGKTHAESISTFAAWGDRPFVSGRRRRRARVGGDL